MEFYTPNMVTTASTTEDRALALLGSGVGADAVAAALGVTPARISQLLSDEVFAEQVTALRYESLQKHNVRDDRYDTIEDSLLDKLERQLPLIMRPMDTVRAIQAVNNCKRRGQSAPDQITNQQNIVNLLIPTIIKQQFTVNVDNQVIVAGDQTLTTMQAGHLLEQVEQVEEGQDD